jgi:hypothetical protein
VVEVKANNDGGEAEREGVMIVRIWCLRGCMLWCMWAMRRNGCRKMDES